MNQPDESDAPPIPQHEQPPVNAAQGCFRVVSWIVPTGFAWASAVGLGTLGTGALRMGQAVPVMIWIVLNIAFVLGAGWFDAMLSRAVRNARADERPALLTKKLVVFFLLQLVFIPVISAAVLFAWCVAYPIHF